MVLGHKYFAKNSDGTHSLFSVDTCENCNCEVEAPNSVNSPTEKYTLLACGLTERTKPTSDLMYCEALDMATCDSCYIEDEY